MTNAVAVLTELRTELEVEWSELTEKLAAIDLLLGRSESQGPTALSNTIEITTPAPADAPSMSTGSPKNTKKRTGKRKAAKRTPAKGKKRASPSRLLDWFAIREEWEGGSESRTLATKYGCHQTTIDGRKRSEGWVRRVEPTRKGNQPVPDGFCPKCRMQLTGGNCSHCGYRG
jgi:hypothetical protein